jgi:hypothetical protein
MSYATINTANISISPVRLSYDGVDLGAVEGDVTVTIEKPNAEIKVAQYGDSIIDLVNKGSIIKVKARLLEVSPNTMKHLFPAAFKVGSTGVYFASNVGYKLSQYAKPLVIHPLDKDDADLTKDIRLFSAISMSPGEIPYSPETITGFEIEWLALPDFSVGAQARYAYFGNPSVGITNASAAAAVAVGGNVGNGTVGSLVVSNAATRTETVTLRLVTAAVNGGVFHVTGSNPARSMGLATVGTPFVSDDGAIGFTVADGATDFALNDQFNIATTAANYI